MIEIDEIYECFRCSLMLFDAHECDVFGYSDFIIAFSFSVDLECRLAILVG